MQGVGNGPVLALALAAAGGGAAATLATPHHGARSALEVRVPSFLQCGRALGSVELTFPAAEHVPASIPARDVEVGGRAAGAVRVAGRSVTVTAPRPAGMICDSLSQGTMVVTFARAAGLRNPARAGAYVLRAKRNGSVFALRLKVS
jgi:hypothetical protein